MVGILALFHVLMTVSAVLSGKICSYIFYLFLQIHQGIHLSVVGKEECAVSTVGSVTPSHYRHPTLLLLEFIIINVIYENHLMYPSLHHYQIILHTPEFE